MFPRNRDNRDTTYRLLTIIEEYGKAKYKILIWTEDSKIDFRNYSLIYITI